MLPCNVIVQELARGKIEVARSRCVDGSDQQSALLDQARIVGGKLEKVIQSLCTRDGP